MKISPLIFLKEVKSKKMEEIHNNKTHDRLPRVRTYIERKFWVIGGFFIVATFLRLVFSKVFLETIISIIIFLFLFNCINLFVFNKFKNKSAKLIIDFYFLSTFLDIILMAIIIYFLGGIIWLSPFFYSLIMVNLFFLFPKNKAIFLNGLCLVSLIFLIALEYSKAIPYFSFSPWGPENENNVQNTYYALITTIGALAVIFFLSFSSDLFRQTLEAQIVKIKETETEIKKNKNKLEVEIGKRTKDLVDEKKNLEKEVEKRTNELEKRKEVVQVRVKELGELHRIAVTKELEMIELKEKIEDFKK